MFQTPWVRDVTSCIHSHYVNHNLPLYYYIISIYFGYSLATWCNTGRFGGSPVPLREKPWFSPWTVAFHKKHLDRRRWQGRWLWCQCHRHFVIGLIQWSDVHCYHCCWLRWVGGAPPPKKKLGHLQETKQENSSSNLGLPTHFRGYFPAGIESIDAALQLFDMCRPVTWHQLAGLGKCF